MTVTGVLNITNALLLGCVIGWFVRTHTTNDRYLMAKTLKYETEASYYIHKLDEQIQENKGNIARERKQK